MTAKTLAEQASEVAQSAGELAHQAQTLSDQAAASMQYVPEGALETASGTPFFVQGLTVFVLACFVGYYVVWRVTPALHSPLMSVTNAISSVIIVGALIAAGPAAFGFSTVMGLFAVVLASVNIFGGFLVTRRMLHMFQKKQ